MAVIAAGMITLSFERDILANYRYYKLQSSTATPPAVPTSIATLPPSGWTDTEPTYTEGSTNTLYTVDLTTYSDGGFHYTPVLKSSSYEAAKSAYNKAVTAQSTAEAAQESIDNLEIGGRNLILDSGVETNNTSYINRDILLSDEGKKLNTGDIVTFTMKARIATDRTRWGLYNSGGSTANKVAGFFNISPDGETDVIYTWSGPWTAVSSQSYIRIYLGTASTKTTVNTIYWAKLERGNKATDWSPAPEDVNAAIEGIEIGGRNLIINTLYPDVSTNDSRPRIFGQESYTVTRSDPTVAKHGMRTTNPSGVTSYPYMRFGPSSGNHVGLNGLVPGETYTFSSDLTWKVLSNYTSEEVRKMQISVYVIREGSTSFSLLVSSLVLYITPGVEQSAKGICTFTLPEDATAMYIIIRDSTSSSSYALEGDFLELANIKLEKGNKATDWTPAPEDHELSIADSRSWYAECASEGADTTKIATITPATDLFTLRPGVMVAVKFSAKNSGAVGSLMLNVNGTGAKSIKYINNNTIGNLPGADYILADRTYQFYYDGTYWIIQLNYNSNTNYYDRIRFQVAITAKSAIAAKNIIVAGSDGKYFHLKSNTAFDITYPILYAVDAIKAAATGTNNYLAFYFAIATTQSLTMTANKAVYIKGTLNGTMFTPVSTTPLTQTVPTSADGYHYIRLGMAYTSANIYMDTDHSVYVYNSGGFKTTAQIAEEARTRVQAMFNNLNGVDQFNTLTQNGALNGIFYSESGEAYINADFIKTNSLAADKIAVTDLNAFSATIGGFQIDNKVNENDTTTISSIHTAGVAVTSNADNSVALASDLFTRTLGGVERQNLKFAIGSNFGVGKDGTIYATNGVFTGTISGSTIIFNAESEGVDYSLTASANTWPSIDLGRDVIGTLFTGAGGFGINASLVDILANSQGLFINSRTDDLQQSTYAGVISMSAGLTNTSWSTVYLDPAGSILLRLDHVRQGYHYIQMDYQSMELYHSYIYLNAPRIELGSNDIGLKDGGYLGYVGSINSSGSLADWWTQGQYSVSGATGRPNKSSAYGILLSFMGNANEDSYTDDYAHSWGLQLYSDNDQLYYRTKTKTGASTWKSTFVTRKDVEVVLSSQTWNTTGAGMYYSGNLLTSAEAAYWDHIDSVSLTSGWQHLRKTDIVIPYINGANVALMSNVNSFYATGSKVTVRITGRRGVSNA